MSEYDDNGADNWFINDEHARLEETIKAHEATIAELQEENKWKPIETIPNDLFVDVWVTSKNNPDWGVRITNVSKTDKHSQGWTGIESNMLTDDIRPTFWKPITPPTV